ncbi:MAG: hypothetical protein LBP59_07230 [Planctomycetaceae bacterium]|nr:hypothetical protein [Planctomycetaceae bacterium]
MSAVSILSEDLIDGKINCCSSCSADECLADEIIVTKKGCHLNSACHSCHSLDAADNFCYEKSNERKRHEPESCPCCLRSISSISRYFVKPSFSLQKVLNEWKVDLYVLPSALLQTIDNSVIISCNNFFETPVSRLPLRLHLLLLVLLN